MSAKTKIVVLHMKELIYTGIFVALGILLVILLIMMFGSDKETSGENASPAEETSEETAPTSSDSLYIPGIYTTELVLGGQTVEVKVVVDKDAISSIELVNLSEAVTTMYPLLQPTLDTLCEQIYTTQSLDQITYTADSKYTSLVLLEAIQHSLDKASTTQNVMDESPSQDTPDEASIE